MRRALLFVLILTLTLVPAEASPPRGIVGVPPHVPCTPVRASPPSRSCPAPRPRHRARRGPIQQTAGTHLHHGRPGSTRLATTATRSKPERAALCVGRRHGLIGAVRHTGKTGADCEAHERCCFSWMASRSRICMVRKTGLRSQDLRPITAFTGRPCSPAVVGPGMRSRISDANPSQHK